jgi:hypothetical protein
MNCPNCGFANPANLRFCGSCGTRLSTTCPECGFANPLDFRFCGMCGTRLNTESAPPVIEQPALLPATEAEPLLPAAPPPLEGERRVVTVVLTDLTDSTNLLEQIGTEGWVELMNRILHILESEIYRFGGEISQAMDWWHSSGQRLPMRMIRNGPSWQLCPCNAPLNFTCANSCKRRRLTFECVSA